MFSKLEASNISECRGRRFTADTDLFTEPNTTLNLYKTHRTGLEKQQLHLVPLFEALKRLNETGKAC